MIRRTLEKLGVSAILDLVEGMMTVKTTRKVWERHSQRICSCID